MFGCTIRRLAPRRVPVIAISVASCSTFGMVPLTASASDSHTVPTCFHNQLVVAVAWDEPPAAGSNGIRSPLRTSARLPAALMDFQVEHFSRPLQEAISRSVEWRRRSLCRMRPHLVIIKPGEDASFGIGFGDGSNQEDPSGAPCMTLRC